MSDARTDFFESGAKGATAAKSRDDFFAGNIDVDKEVGKKEQSVEVPAKLRQAGIGEGLLSAATSIPASMIAGVNMTASLLGGRGIDDSLARFNKTKDFLTYNPRTEMGQEAAQGFGKALNLLGPTEAHWAAEKMFDATGSPMAGAATETLGNAAAMLLGAKGARSIRPELGERPVISPQDALNKAASGQSMGAAADTQSISAAAAHPNVSRVSPALRKEIMGAYNNGTLDREAAARKIDADTLPIPMTITEAEARNDTHAISNERNSRAKDPERGAFYQKRNQDLIDNLGEIRRSASPNVIGRDSLQHGQQLIDSYKAIFAPVKADIAAKYQALRDANGGEFPVNGNAFVEAADKSLADNYKSKRLPSDVRAELDDLRGSGNMPYQRFEELRTTLATDARKADRVGDGNAAAAIRLVRNALESLPMEGEAANIKTIADAARKANADMHRMLEADPALRAAVEDGVEIGELSPEADKFIHKYVVNGKAANLQRMRQNLSGDTLAGETITAGALDYLDEKSGARKGAFSQAGYNNAMRDLGPRAKFLMSDDARELTEQLGRVANNVVALPAGHHVNTSNTIPAMAEGAKDVAAKIVDYKLGGIPGGSFLKKKLESHSAHKEWERITSPGAGLALRDIPGVKKNKPGEEP